MLSAMTHFGALLPEARILDPRVFGDERGFFFESYNRRHFAEAVGRDVEFVQDNHSKSIAGVLRGLHYQLPNPQGKLVRVVRGAIWDVAVDIRKSSETFKQWMAVELSEENKRQFWIPEGFAHGFVVLSETAEVEYKTTAYYDAQADRALAWDEPELAIEWPVKREDLILSAKDRAASPLDSAVLFE